MCDVCLCGWWVCGRVCIDDGGNGPWMGSDAHEWGGVGEVCDVV